MANVSSVSFAHARELRDTSRNHVNQSQRALVVKLNDLNRKIVEAPGHDTASKRAALRNLHHIRTIVDRLSSVLFIQIGVESREQRSLHCV